MEQVASRGTDGARLGPVAALTDIGAVVSPAYLVGGSVRDMVMDRRCDDLDVATPLRPDEVEARIRAAGRRPYLVGKRFGTIGFTLSGRKVEVTTFRTQSYAERGRPGITFVDDLGTDLAHRDFTMNAMAQSVDGELIDPHGGQADIGARTIRCVGRPNDRFDEDPLRMLRAARFVSTLGFSIERATAEAARKEARRILAVARERWLLELDRLLVGPHAGAGLRALAELGLLRFVLPELQLQVGYDQNSPWHARPLFEHTIGVVEAVPADLTLRWAALLHDIGKPYARVEKPGRSTYVMHERIGAEMVERIGLYLRWPTRRREEVRALVSGHMGRDSVLRAADDAAKG
jgi:putative nucleotidyltransferase with HDIG domain